MREIFPVLQIPKHKKFICFLGLLVFDKSLNRVVSTILDYYYPGFAIEDSSLHNVPLFLVFVSLVILAPLFETLVFQFALLEIMNKLKIPASIAIVLNTIIFFLFHNYNFAYVLAILTSGWVLSYYYMALRDQGKYNKILLVALLHVLGNVPVFFDYA